MINDNIIITNRDDTVFVTVVGKVDIKKTKLNYKKIVTIKGKRRISWYTDYKTIQIAYNDMSSSDFLNLDILISNYPNDIVIYFKNERFNAIVDGDTFSFSSEYSNELEDDLYSGNMTFEESIEEDIGG